MHEMSRVCVWGEKRWQVWWNVWAWWSYCVWVSTSECHTRNSGREGYVTLFQASLCSAHCGIKSIRNLAMWKRTKPYSFKVWLLLRLLHSSCLHLELISQCIMSTSSCFKPWRITYTTTFPSSLLWGRLAFYPSLRNLAKVLLKEMNFHLLIVPCPKTPGSWMEVEPSFCYCQYLGECVHTVE